METRNNPEARTRWKFDLVKRLYQKGYSKKDVVQLFSFIDWVMSLPQKLSRRFWDNLISFEEEYKMPYVTSVEKIGIEKGMLLEAQDVLIEVLDERFGGVSGELSEQIKRIDSRERLKTLIRHALRVKSFEEFGKKVN